MTALALSALDDNRQVAVLKNISLCYGKTQALDDLSLNIPAGIEKLSTGRKFVPELPICLKGLVKIFITHSPYLKMSIFLVVYSALIGLSANNASLICWKLQDLQRLLIVQQVNYLAV